MTSPSNEEEYDMIVNFIDSDMSEYSDGSLSIPEIVMDLHKRYEDSLEGYGDILRLLYKVWEEITEVSNTPISKNLQREINEFFDEEASNE